MNKIQIQKQESYLSIAAVFATNATAVGSLAGLADASEALSEHLGDIDLSAKIQASPSGASEAKRSALNALGDCGVLIAGAVHSFAEKAGDFELAGRVDFSRTDLVSGSGAAVVALARGILDAATEHLDSLGDDGVTTAKLNAFKQAIKTYDSLRTLPRQAKAARGAATKQLKRSFVKTDRLRRLELHHQFVHALFQQPIRFDERALQLFRRRAARGLGLARQRAQAVVGFDRLLE